MGRYKVPSQAASGADSFSDDLVGNQITQGSPLMTGTNFAIEKDIPEKDSKQFITQPFSDYFTWDTIQKETATTGSGTASTTVSNVIKFNNDKENADRSLYGSLRQRLGVSVTDIINKFPAAVMADTLSPIGLNSNTAESISYDVLTNTTEFKVQYSLLYNPLAIVLKTPQSSILPETDNAIRNFFSSYTKYVIDLSGNTFNIINYIEPDSTNKLTLRVEGNCFDGYSAYTQNYLIRPNNGIVENFYDELDDLERVLLNRDTNPIFNAAFNIPRDTHGGYVTETITEYVNWPVSRDGWNIQIIGLDYDYYVNKLSALGEEIDGYKSNLIIRFLTSPQLYEFDTEEKKIESIFQIYGQSFDQVKKFIDNIAYMRNVSYDSINNVPDILLKNLAETLGLSTVSLFDEKSLQDSLYTRHDIGYDGISTGTNLIEAEYEFYRRLLVNLAWLYKSKGTRTAIEFFLKFIGAPEPMIRLDEYVYKVDGPLPSTNVESDIQDVILGYKTFNVVSYNTGTTQYDLIQVTGSTTLTRAEYPVDELTGLPRAVEYSDGSMFFEKGAGWYRKTLDHRSPDILDEANSDLASRVKVIKTMAKPFTYGEDYFNVYRSLPGLGYGYSLSSEIDNEKTEVVQDDYTSKLTLNRKNINVFLSADRAIDYDIYRKSRDLLLDFGTVTPAMTSGITFAEFLDTIISEAITNSHVIKYKPFYVDLLTIYNEYQDSQTFTPYNYVTVNDFINRLSPYWVNIVEQFIPATTLWTGGNVIENGLFNRSKFKHRQPCVPLTYTVEEYPDFETVITEDLESIIGSGSYDGNDNALDNFRGLQIFNGVTFNVMVEINGTVYTGATFNLQPFSGFSPTSDCTILTATTDSIPLICGYTGNTFTTSDITELDGIKEAWKDALDQLIAEINSIYTGETGFNITIEYFEDVDRTQAPPRDIIEYIRLTIIFNEYYGCSGNETFEYYFEPTYNLDKVDCDLRIAVEAIGSDVFSDISSCQLISNLEFNVSNAVGDEMGNWPIYIRTGCTGNVNDDPIQQSSGCVYMIPSIKESDRFGMLFTDAANCEQKIRVDGLQAVIIDYGATTGYTAYARTEYVPTYNFGLPSGTTVYVLNSLDLTPPTGYTHMLDKITNGELIEFPIENIVVGYRLLSIELKPYSQMSTADFRNAGTNGYSFAFNYTYSVVTAIDCLSTTKTSHINGEYEVLPTSKVLVYTNTDINLQTVPYRFEYKYPEDLFPKDGTQAGDYMIDYTGYPIEVSGVTLDYCGYNKPYYQINVAGSGGTNILINGLSGSSYNKIIVSFKEEVIDPLTFKIDQYFIGLGYDESSPINATRPVLTGYDICGGGSPGPSSTPAPTISPSRTPTPSRSIAVTPSRSVTPSITPSLSVSATVTPSVSVTASVTPSISITPTITPTNGISPTPTPTSTPSETPSITPSISVSRTVTPTVSISPSYAPEGRVNFESLDGDVASIGYTGNTIGGRTFTISFSYLITAAVDNVWSGGQYPVQAHTYFYLSTDSGSTYSEIDYISAEVPGYGPPDESDYQSRNATYTLTDITEDQLRGIRIYGQYDCAWAQDQMTGSLDVTITGFSTNFGMVNIVCNNKYSMGCLTTTVLSCGPEVTPTPSVSFGYTPTPTRTPSITPTTSPTQFFYRSNIYSCSGSNCGTFVYSVDFEFPTAKTVGKWYALPGDGNTVVYIVSGTTSGVLTNDAIGPYDTCNQACAFVPSPTPTITPTPSPTGYDYFYYATIWTCTGGNCGSQVTSENIATYMPLVVGRWYILGLGSAVYYIEYATAGPGTPRNMVGGPYATCNDACKVPALTPSSQAPSPSVSRTPSITAPSRTPTRSVTPSISRTPSPSREVIPVSIDNYINTNTLITDCTINGVSLVNFDTFPLYPGDYGSGDSPVGTGTYSIAISLSGSRISNMYMTLNDSNGVDHCLNVSPSDTLIVFLNCAVNTSGGVEITFLDSGLCPSPSKSVPISRTPTPTPPSPTPTRSVTPTLGRSPTPTRTPSPVYYLNLDVYSMNFNESGYACDNDQIAITTNCPTWYATPSGDIAPYLNVGGAGWGNAYTGSYGDTVFVMCSTGDIKTGYIVFSAPGLSPNVNCYVTTGYGCT